VLRAAFRVPRAVLSAECLVRCGVRRAAYGVSRNRDNRLLYNVAGGWQISGSTRVATGVPLTINTSVNTANSFGAGTNPLRPDLVGDPDDAPGTVEQFFNVNVFRQPGANTFGNSPRSVIRLPYQNANDLGVFKNFDVGAASQRSSGSRCSTSSTAPTSPTPARCWAIRRSGA
jgi:hypothetical protein